MTDIAIAGGGPAGALAATLLRRAGLSVALVDAGGAPDRIEGLSPRVTELLRGLGLPVEGVSAPVRRQARWGRMAAAPNRESIVARGAFDAALRRAAVEAGARLTTARVARLAPGALHLDDGSILRARLVVEARGRRAPAAPGSRRGPASIAVAGIVGDAPGAPGARIAAARDGWVWRARTPAAGCWTQVLTDAAALAAGKAGLRAAWDAFFDDPAAGPRAPFPAAPLVRAAELRLTAPELDPDAPRIGDAAMAMDPLSGHGVFWALSSALALPPIAAALLESDAGLARRFHRDRLTETFLRQARIGRDFHRLADLDTPFWRARSAWPDDAPAHPAPAAPRRARRVVVRDGRLEEADALITAHEPGGAAFVLGRPLAPILDRLRRGTPAREAFPAAILPEAPPREALAIHDWLMSRGALAPASTEPPTTGETCR